MKKMSGFDFKGYNFMSNEVSFEEKKVLLLEELMSACKHGEDEKIVELYGKLEEMFVKKD